jgi:ComF family protein
MIPLIREVSEGLTHLFFPHSCRCCGFPLGNRKAFLCFTCKASLPVTGFEAYAENPVEKTFFGRIPIVAASAYLFFNAGSATQQLVHRIKYKDDPELAVELGRFMGRALEQSRRFPKLDAVVPLPLFRNREKLRGYNQAGKLAQGLAEAIGIPAHDHLVKRIRSSSTQTNKTRTERWQNVDGLFETGSKTHLQGQQLLLVDDVITTGATLEACASALLQAGAVVSVATLAFAMK